MSYSNTQPPQINLARRAYEQPLFVDMEAFFEFSFWMAEELLDLEALCKLTHPPHVSNTAAIPASIANRLRSVVD